MIGLPSRNVVTPNRNGPTASGRFGLVVSIDFGVPLVPHAYAGTSDVTQFPEIVAELVARFWPLAQPGQELTLVYHAGQDSTANQQVIEDSPLHFVGSLPPSQHPDLWRSRCAATAPSTCYGSPVRAFETRVVVFGTDRRGRSPTPRACTTNSAKASPRQSTARRQLAEIAARLKRGKSLKTRAQVEAEIAEILKPRWLTCVISTTLHGDKPSELRLEHRTKPNAIAALETELFGKRILFTDRDNCPRRSRRRLPVPVKRRSRLPPDERPQSRVVLADVPLDRPQNPRARRGLRARPNDRTTDGPRSRPRRHAHECP